MINSPFDDKEVKTSSASTIHSDEKIVVTSKKSAKNWLVTIGILITASLSGYFGLMLLHNTLLSSTTAPNPNPNPNLPKPVSAISSSSSSVIKSSEAMDSDDLPIIQNTTQSHQIALKFKNNTQSLNRVIDKIVKYCQTNKFSTESLSISLVNLKTNERIGYKNDVGRYPASVVKLFWLFHIYEATPNDPNLQSSIDKMILKSDNNGASQVLDYITKTKSSSVKLSPQEFRSEKQKRKSLNLFYQNKGYSPSINISQKTFPIPKENLMEPTGFDKQLRGNDTQKLTRNKITTDDAALLLHEVINNPHQQMRTLLTRNTDPNFWKKQPPNPIDFNPVESFFGEGLEDLGSENIISKAGWTSASRQEVAYIKSKDGKTEYILTVFGDSADYAKSKKIFPEISKLVYQEMQNISK
jgi:Beta-lactamase enzyme family